MIRFSKFPVDRQTGPCNKRAVPTDVIRLAVCRLDGLAGTSKFGARRMKLHVYPLRVGHTLVPVLAICFLSLAGCAFDISRVKQQPVSYTATAVSTEGFILSR